MVGATRGSEPGRCGTEVELTVPYHIAFQPPSSDSFGEGWQDGLFEEQELKGKQ